MSGTPLSFAAECRAPSARYSVEGTVIRGQALGRTLGFPTLNVALRKGPDIPTGVYASAVLCRGVWYAGVTDVGTRPTVGGKEKNCETYLLDFRGDLYGETVRVCLCRFLRDERTFPSVGALSSQLRTDEAEARAYFLSLAAGGTAQK